MPLSPQPLNPATTPVEPSRVPRIGYLTSSPPDSLVAQGGYQQFLKGLQELGYVDGDNIVIEYRSSDGQPDRFPTLVDELVNLQVDAIVVGDGRALDSALAATSTIPVITPIGDITGSGYAPEPSRPRGNLTGLTNLAKGLSGKRLELLLRVLPSASRIGVLRNSAFPPGDDLWVESQAAATDLRVDLVSLEIRSSDDIAGAFERAIEEDVHALIVLPDPLANTNASEIVRRASQSHLPAMYGIRAFADIGGLMSYGPNREAMFRRAAYYVQKILESTKPADLPIEQPTTFDLVVNLKTARELDIVLPRSLLIDATDLVE